MPIRPLLQRLRDKDPQRDGLRRALRAAVMVPVAAGIALALVGGRTAPLFALLGSIWLLVVTEFPGDRRQRAIAYLGLAAGATPLIVAGSLLAPVPWLAVAIVFALGAAVTYAAAASATLSAGQRAVLLAFVWPVSTPAESLADRLLGWLIAVAVCVPAALYLFPPRHHDGLRSKAAQACRVLADRIEGCGPADAVVEAMDGLRAEFMAVAYQPVGLSAGSRALVRVVDFLELASDTVDADTGAVLGPIADPAVDILRRCAAMLETDEPADREALGRSLPRLRALARERYRDAVRQILEATDDAAAIAAGRRLLSCRVVTTTIGLTGRVVAAAVAADARPAWARALGLRLPPSGLTDRPAPDSAAASQAIPSRFLGVRSVAAHNSLRTGVGLALAVAVTHLHPVQHGFWVVVGTMTVLGSSAVSTRTRVVQAVVGTALGIALGAALVAAVGARSEVLWALLPVSVFGSAYLPRLFSFGVAQAMGALSLLITLNLTDPSGWRVGLLRIEDVAMGAAMGLIVSLLLWPRGASAAASALIAEAQRVNLRYLRAAVLRVTRHPGDAVALAALGREAGLGNRMVDDAVRQYLRETGSEAHLRTPVVRAANHATWVRIAADLIADIRTLPPGGACPGTREVLERHLDFVERQIAGRDDGPGPPLAGEFVRALRGESRGDALTVENAQPLVTVAANLAQLEYISRVTPEAAVVAG